MSTVVTKDDVLAHLNRAKSGLLTSALLDRPLTAQFWRGQVNALASLLRQQPAPGALAVRDAASGGYQPNPCFERAWAALPDRLEHLALVEMQDLLRAQGIEITPEPIPDRNVDAVVEGKRSEGTFVVQAHEKHAPAPVDVRDGTCRHAAAPMTSAAIVPPAPGTYWPEQQAWYAGPIAYPDGRVIALLLPDGQDQLGKATWGESGKDVAGAKSHHDGKANTAAMAAAGSAAARAVLAINPDWYIPSQIEALQVYATLKEQIGLGWTWTSTQSSASTAFVQDFEDGLSNWDLEDGGYRVRAVRGLPLHNFTTSTAGAAS